MYNNKNTIKSFYYIKHLNQQQKNQLKLHVFRFDYKYNH